MINYITLEGKTNYEIGFNHGRKLASQIQSLINEALSTIRNSFFVFKIIPLSFLVWLLSLFLRFKFSKENMEEMKGVSKGSNIPLRWIVFLNVFFDIGQILLSLQIADVTWGCSGLMGKDKNGNILLGKTFDLSPAKLLIKYRTIFSYKCAWLKYSYRIFSLPGIIGGDFYENSNGITAVFFQGGLTKSWNNFLRDGYTVSVFKDFFGNAGTLDEAIKYIKDKTKTIASFLCMISDGNKGYLIELYSCHYKIYTLEDSPLVSTNHFLSSEMVNFYINNYKNNKYYKDSLWRYEYIKSQVKKEIAVDMIKKIFQHKSESGSIATPITVFGLIKNCSKGTTYITPSEKLPATYGGEYAELPKLL